MVKIPENFMLQLIFAHRNTDRSSYARCLCMIFYIVKDLVIVKDLAMADSLSILKEFQVFRRSVKL